MDYENCEYFVAEDVTPYHNDVFDHPQYDYFCTKNDKKHLYTTLQVNVEDV